MSRILSLLRVKQWIKNAFVFVAAFFGKALTLANLHDLCIAFISFCFISSAVYILNDYRDLEQDRMHPKKSKRPLASGEVSIVTAVITAILLATSSLLLAGLVQYQSLLYLLLLYAVINIFYSFGLKKVAIVDLILVSSGFVLRVIGGAVVVNVVVSFWLLLMTFLFSMFIVIGKRRDDFKYGSENANQLRLVNKSYSLAFLDYSILIFSTLLLVCYVMYTYFSPYFSSNIYWALISNVLVFMGLMRYLQTIFVEDKGGSPTEFAFKDKFIKIVLLLWAMVFAYLIYFK